MVQRVNGVNLDGPLYGWPVCHQWLPASTTLLPGSDADASQDAECIPTAPTSFGWVGGVGGVCRHS